MNSCSRTSRASKLSPRQRIVEEILLGDPVREPGDGRAGIVLKVSPRIKLVARWLFGRMGAYRRAKQERTSLPQQTIQLRIFILHRILSFHTLRQQPESGCVRRDAHTYLHHRTAPKWRQHSGVGQSPGVGFIRGTIGPKRHRKSPYHRPGPLRFCQNSIHGRKIGCRRQAAWI